MTIAPTIVPTLAENQEIELCILSCVQSHSTTLGIWECMGLCHSMSIPSVPHQIGKKRHNTSHSGAASKREHQNVFKTRTPERVQNENTRVLVGDEDLYAVGLALIEQNQHTLDSQNIPD
ncbi:hypothetical protein M8J77_008895 [Diaphorina citri]|nr:hypothetical protein M8J77_008895 [Diaphorina citri]